MKKYLKNFLLHFVLYFIIFALATFFSKDEAESNIVSLGIVLGLISFGLAIVVTIFTYINENLLHPYFFKRLRNNSVFHEFHQRGLKIEESKNLLDERVLNIESIYSNYLIFISFSEPKPISTHVSIIIGFNPKSNNKFLTNDDIKSLNKTYKKEKLHWTFHSVFYSSHIKNSNLSSIFIKIDELISLLKSKKFQPISEKEIEILRPEIEKLIEAKTWDYEFV